MLSILVAIYRANPFRPHCGPKGHVKLCQWLGFPIAQDGPRCGGFDE